MINSAPVSGTFYLDTNVAAGAAYCHRATSVLAGVESSPSHLAVAASPPPSDRQAVCAHRGGIIGRIRCLGSRPKRPVQGHPRNSQLQYALGGGRR